jgi:GT2 family glycosyltransferase
MVKCLPGPMPLWKKSMHDKCGFFDEDNCNYADDWEMWLRAVDNGCTFMRSDDIVGTYTEGGRSQQNDIEQRKEEAHIFFKYAHLFPTNFAKFQPYFSQFLEK